LSKSDEEKNEENERTETERKHLEEQRAKEAASSAAPSDPLLPSRPCGSTDFRLSGMPPEKQADFTQTYAGDGQLISRGVTDSVITPITAPPNATALSAPPAPACNVTSIPFDAPAPSDDADADADADAAKLHEEALEAARDALAAQRIMRECQERLEATRMRADAAAQKQRTRQQQAPVSKAPPSTSTGSTEPFPPEPTPFLAPELSTEQRAEKARKEAERKHLEERRANEALAEETRERMAQEAVERSARDARERLDRAAMDVNNPTACMANDTFVREREEEERKQRQRDAAAWAPTSQNSQSSWQRPYDHGFSKGSHGRSSSRPAYKASSPPVLDPSGNRVCRHWMRGHCSMDMNCGFSHHRDSYGVDRYDPPHRDHYSDRRSENRKGGFDAHGDFHQTRYPDAPMDRDDPNFKEQNDKVYCAIHHKERTVSNMNRLSDGRWICCEKESCQSGTCGDYKGFDRYKKRM